MKTITGKNFANKKELVSYLVKNKLEIIKMKKTSLKFTDATVFTGDESQVTKSLLTNFKDDETSGVIKRTIIGNTYNWMDSQNDVLLPGVFTKSISERQKDIWHLHDHERLITSKVGKPISIYEKSIAWKDLGVDKEGFTTALFMDSDIMKEYNGMVFLMYKNGDVTQHSVGMYYVNISLAINDPEEKVEYAVWNKYINQIGNKAECEKDGFFWAVTEGKLIEISGVLAGSNELTPTLANESKTKASKSMIECTCGCNVDTELAMDGVCTCPDCGTEYDAETMQPKAKSVFNIEKVIAAMPVTEKKQPAFDMNKVIKSMNK